jgi:hypothetical protein
VDQVEVAVAVAETVPLVEQGIPHQPLPLKEITVDLEVVAVMVPAVVVVAPVRPGLQAAATV